MTTDGRPIAAAKDNDGGETCIKCKKVGADLLVCSVSSLAQQWQLFVCYVFGLDLLVTYLKVMFSYTQKSAKFRMSINCRVLG